MLAATPLSASVTPTDFGDSAVSMHWTISGDSLHDVTVDDALNGRRIVVDAPFSITLADGQILRMSDFRLAGAPAAGTIPAQPNAARLADRTVRRTMSASFSDAGGRLRVDWRLIQASGAHYLREEVTVTALKSDVAISRIDLLDATATGAEVLGRTAGAPVVAGPDYLMIENPLSKASTGVDNGHAQLWIDRTLPLRLGKPVTYSAVLGVSGAGQLRRDFLAYVEQERAHPYRPFLHYNSWYDIGFENPYSEADALDRINAFGEELVRRRGVKLDSFLFDDGWDDLSGRWRFSKAFPNGFKTLRTAAARYGAAPGVWLSPWGGYDKAKLARVAAGRAAGYEIVDGGLALSGPHYYDRFHAATMALVQDDGVNQFKLDGTGNADRVVPGSRFDSDFAAAIQLIDDLRAAKPDLFVNLTTGTYPSPAWLRYADSIWRGGEDHAFTGVGTPRQRWITYRDRETYANIVERGPLFPLNAVMLHGIIYAQHAPGLDSDPGNDFADEVHSYFGSGTALQELYITPKLLTAANWDTLAEAARWARDNADVLRDTHWIGGDPGRLQIYGWASWSPHKSIVTLRNPDAAPQTFTLDLRRALELPAGASTQYRAGSPWPTGDKNGARALDADHPSVITLSPFEVVTLELSPTTVR
ncbi:enterotoxin [Sphingomonas koreensis]|nr:enterotoxin [Sphingomonas koreensis]